MININDKLYTYFINNLDRKFSTQIRIHIDSQVEYEICWQLGDEMFSQLFGNQLYNQLCNQLLNIRT
jgi:hypothetical protein